MWGETVAKERMATHNINSFNSFFKPRHIRTPTFHTMQHTPTRVPHYTDRQTDRHQCHGQKQCQEVRHAPSIYTMLVEAFVHEAYNIGTYII